MARYFVVANGMIENVIEADPSFELAGRELHPADGFEEGGPGWGWDGSPVPPVVAAPQPSDIVLSDRQLRLGLIAAGVLPSTVRSSIEGALTDPLEREAMLTWFDYTRDIRWDHPVTQQLMAIAGFTPEAAGTMWLAAAQIAA